jgi:hypothetical protein
MSSSTASSRRDRAICLVDGTGAEGTRVSAALSSTSLLQSSGLDWLDMITPF